MGDGDATVTVRVTLPVLEGSGGATDDALVGAELRRLWVIEQVRLHRVGVARGAVLASSARLSLGLALPIVAAFGLLHGNAHGLEPAAGNGALRYAVGLLLATAALHGAGVLGAMKLSAVPVRIAGGAMAAAMVLAILV